MNPVFVAGWYEEEKAMVDNGENLRTMSCSLNYRRQMNSLLQFLQRKVIREFAPLIKEKITGLRIISKNYYKSGLAETDKTLGVCPSDIIFFGYEVLGEYKALMLLRQGE